ncbi:hypothetical protein JCM6882_003941 [Rhodosporidiobolus microsporus]
MASGPSKPLSNDTIMAEDHSPNAPTLVPTNGTQLHPAYSSEQHYKGAAFDQRISREGAGDLGHMARTIEEHGFYKRVGNPGLTGLAVHAVTLMSISTQFMQWRGVVLPNVFVGNLWFCSGLYMFLVSIFTMIKGETFSSMVFSVFGAFYLSYAAILTPAFGATAAFGDDTVSLNNALAIYLFVWNGAFFIIFLASLRTNACLVLLFFGVTMGVWLLAGSYVELAKLAGSGLTTSATFRALSKGGGAFLFISACSGFYLVLVQIFEAVDMPFTLPVGDLTRFWPKKKRA